MKTVTYPEVLGFTTIEGRPGIKIELQLSETTFGFSMVDFDDLLNFEEEAGAFLRDKNYYKHSIQEMLERYITECEDDYKIEKEAV